MIREVESLTEPALDAYRRALLAAQPAIEAQAAALAERIAAMKAAGTPATEWQVFASQRARLLAEITAQEISRAAAGLAANADSWASQAILTGIEDARALVATQLGDAAGAAMSAWTRPNFAAVQALVGSMQGETLGTLFDALGRDASARVRRGLVSGLLAGRNPRAVGRVIRQETALSAARAELISRTEILRAHRTASVAAYDQNRDAVKGFRRLAAKSARSCAGCLGLDGREQPTDEMMPSHPGCRCAVVPIVDRARFGLSPEPARENGSAWLARQDAEVQDGILGKAGGAKYREGTPLSRWVVTSVDPDWGPQVRVRSLKEVA